MTLLCINNKELKLKIKDSTILCNGEGLKEGSLYKTKGKPYVCSSGIRCYYIDGLGEKLECRFTEYLEDKELMKQESEIDKLVREALK